MDNAPEMKQTLLQEKYPVYTLEVDKIECRFADIDAIMGHLRDCVEGHKVARMIGEFDHFAHTRALPEGEIAGNIRAAKHIVFCFGTHLPNPHVMAVRPRSIGVADMGDRFVISFLEAPMPLANNAMETWVKAVVAHPPPLQPDLGRGDTLAAKGGRAGLAARANLL